MEMNVSWSARATSGRPTMASRASFNRSFRRGVRDRGKRHGTPCLEIAHHLGEEPVLPLHLARVVGGAKGAGAGGARGSHSLGREQVQNAVKFQGRQYVLDHPPYQRLYFVLDRALHLG